MPAHPYLAEMTPCLIVQHDRTNAAYHALPSARRLEIKKALLRKMLDGLVPGLEFPHAVRVQVDEEFALLPPKPGDGRAATVQYVARELEGAARRVGPNGEFTTHCRISGNLHRDDDIVPVSRDGEPWTMDQDGLHVAVAMVLSYALPSDLGHPSPNR